MSTSDAGESEPGGGGGGGATRPDGTARTSTARAQQDEAFKPLQQENHHGDISTHEPDSRLSASTQEEPRQVPVSGADRLRPARAHCADSEVQPQKRVASRFTSRLFLTPSNNLGVDKQAQILKKTSRSSHSFIEPLRVERGNSSCQINRETPCEGISVESASTYRLSEASQTKEEEHVGTVVCNELVAAKDLRTSPCFSNDSGSPECNGLHRLPFGKSPVDIKPLGNKLDELSNSGIMLSSTVVTVLAPHWSGRRRSKRLEDSNTSEAQGNPLGVANTTHSFAQQYLQETRNQHPAYRVFTERSQDRLRVPFLGNRSNTVGWSSSSGPASLNYECKRKMIQTISLDVNSGRLGDEDAGSLSPINTAAAPLPPLPRNSSEQRTSQTGHQGGPSTSSSKPTTSSLLLSLRRSSGHSLPKPFCRSSSPGDQDGKLSTALYSQTFLSKSEQAKSKPLLSPSSASCGPSEPGQVLSPLSSSHKERNISGNVLFSSIPTNKDAEDTLASKRCQTMSRPQSGLTCPKHSLSKSPSERQDANTSLFPAKPHSSYDRSATLKEPLFSGRTILTSKSWWKPDALEGRSLLRTSDATQLTDKHNTPTDQPCNDYSDVASPLPNDNKGFASSFSSRVNNNTTESVCRSNTNFATKTQGGLVAQRATEESPDHASDLLVKQPFGSSLNTREPQEPHGLPSALSCSKISSAAAQTALSHSNDLNKQDESNSCISESLPPTLLNPMSSASPTERSSAFHFNHRSPRSYSIPASPHRNEAERQTGSYAAASAVPTNTKSSSTFRSRPVLTNKHSSIHAGSSFQPPSTTNPTPLGFERTYASIPKPFRHTTGSSLIPSVSGFSKTNPTPVSTASIASSPTATHPSLYLTAPPVTPAIKTGPSSLLTPPATPVSHSYSDSSSPKEETNPLSPEKGPKQLSVERKRVRRVTWEDSVDLQHSGPKSLEKPDSSHVPTDPLSPSRSPRSVSTPSIFSFLRSNSPNKTTSPLSSPAPKTSSIQVGNGRKLRSLSSDSADLKSRDRERSRHRPNDTMIFNQERRDSPAHRQERTQSVEADLVQCRTSAALSLPPDFSSDYKLRYSSPPYTSLMSSRSIHGETTTRTLRPPLFQEASRSVYTPQPSTNTDPTEVKILPTSKSQISPTQNSSHTRQNGPVALVNNRVRIISHCLESDNGHDSTCVTETLVYSLKPKVGTSTPAPVNTSPAPVQPTTHARASEEAEVSRRPHRAQRKEPAAKPHSLSDESSTGSSSTESQQLEGEGWGKKVKASVLGKSRFFSVESEQSAKKSRFALKKSISSPNPSLSRSDSDRTTKSNNKVDQVLNKLRQTFGNKRSDDEASFPWKWKRGSQTPSLSGSSDNTTGSTKTLEEQDHPRGAVDRGTEGTARWAQNKYTIIPLSSDQFSARVSDQDGQRALAGCTSDSNPQVHVTVHSPAVHQFDYYNDSRTDSKPTTHFLFCRETPPGCYAAQSRKSTPSPRSPFSPFSSLSPLSPFSSPDTTDDSVFYSPKLQRRRESSSPCEPGEGMSLGASRRSRASTGPPGSGQGQGSQHFTSSYADLKYGIEPGRSFSVSSVLSSRASKPGRISTGSRFMSVGDLSESVLTGASTGRDMDQGSPSWTAGHDCKPAMNSYFPSDPGTMRSRSLPRSLTLANWSSGISICHPAPATSSRPACLWSPSLNPCHFAWDAEGPPTPPPTPPLSPVSRRMSQPSSQPSPGSPQTADSQSSRGHLPSRGYVSSLSTFEESSDSSSDTTTDDEYYLETGGEEKETEL